MFNFIRNNRPTLIFWLTFCFILVVAGQIVIGPLGPYIAAIFVIGLFVTFKLRKETIKAVICFFVTAIIILGFFVVKIVKAESNNDTATKEVVTQPVEEPQEEEQEEPKEEECHALDNFGDNISQWCPLVVRYAKEYDVDPILVASVIQIESKGDPNAVSGMYAIGLMQVMPSDSGYPIFYQRPVSKDLFDPETNIDWGSKILSGYIHSTGSKREGLLHYGPIDYGYIYADQVLAVYDEKKSNQ